jgi:hypothetical protein
VDTRRSSISAHIVLAGKRMTLMNDSADCGSILEACCQHGRPRQRGPLERAPVPRSGCICAFGMPSATVAWLVELRPRHRALAAFSADLRGPHRAAVRCPVLTWRAQPGRSACGLGTRCERCETDPLIGSATSSEMRRLTFAPPNRRGHSRVRIAAGIPAGVLAVAG